MTSQMVYKWVIPVYPVNAQKAGMELEKIAQKRGSLKPAYVVEESTNKKAVLHKCFEWDNDKAADKYRQRQAQDLIRNIVTVKIGKVETTGPIRAFVSFKQDNEFVSVATVINTPKFRETMLETAMKELEAFLRKYNSLEFLAELMPNIEKSIQEYKKCGFDNNNEE